MRRREPGQPGALDLLEEAVALLRGVPRRAILVYFAGTVPFGLGLLYFGADMAQSATAWRSLPETSLVLALLYGVMKTAQSAFCKQLRAQLLAGPQREDRSPGIGSLFLQQIAIQPWSFVALPLAFVITIPFGFAFAFFQNVTALGALESDPAALRRRARGQAMLWPGQNHVLLVVLFAFALFVFANVAFLAAALPSLVRTFTGVSTTLTRSGPYILNTSFLALCLFVTYLVVDPLVKAVYVGRCFHGEALTTGEDLLVALRRRAPTALVTLLLLSASRAFGAPAVDPARLDRSLNEVLSRRTFAWRLPREKPPEAHGPFADFLRGVTELFDRWGSAVGRFIAKAAEWFADAFRGSSSPGGHDAPGWLGFLDSRALVILLLALVGSLAAVFLYRNLRRRKAAPAVAATPVGEIDFMAESVSADAKEPDEWLTLGQEWIEKGDLRRALRALYLAGLATLAETQLVRLARHKSNGDYLYEVQRRVGARAPLGTRFASVVLEFDRVWYGPHPVTPDSLARFRSEVLDLRVHAAG